MIASRLSDDDGTQLFWIDQMLEFAPVYDIEVFPNAFTLSAENFNNDTAQTWEISEFRDDRESLLQWFYYLQSNNIPMIGFNSVGYDYIIIHYLMMNPNCSYADLYALNERLIGSTDKFGFIVWDRDRFAPQIDLFKVHHFDNRAKMTSLKALQINMRSKTVVDSPVEFGKPVTREQLDALVIPYNRHDVSETKQFAKYSLDALRFRIGLIERFGIEVLNWNDVKIGSKMLEQRLGDVCYTWSNGRKQIRQTPRDRIALSEIIFPYIRFSNPEFNRVLDFMRAQVLTPADITDPDSPVVTKGVFTNLTADVGGLTFHFGTGGVHASVSAQKFASDDNYIIRDIDVAALYPNIAIKNRLAPEHLGEAFIAEYAKIPEERALFAKGTYDNAALKLASNGPWGQSNNKFSLFFDPKYAMTIPINGQLMICMLVEWLLQVPTLQLIQANTDGITYLIHKSYESQAAAICKQWEAYTCLTLEDANYSNMWIRDVNNYIAKDTKGKLKQKGAYWHPDPLNYADSISKASPPCWYKDLGGIISTRAAIAAMVDSIDPETFIRAHSDPFDFMLRAKVDRSSRLMLGARELQRTSRYYVALAGAPMVKVSPPPAGCQIGDYKRRNGITESEYQDTLRTIPPGAWDARIHTKNQSRYEMREMSIQAGWNVAECNNVADFHFNNVNYAYYLNEAKKLII